MAISDAAELNRSARASRLSPIAALFVRFLALAHIADEFRFGDTATISTWLIVAAAAWLAVRPYSLVALGLMAITKSWHVLASYPFINNHDLIYLLADAGLIVAMLVSLRRRSPLLDGPEWWRFFRSALLGAYAIAAFSKLNTGFFDPDVSCAVDLTLRAASPIVDRQSLLDLLPSVTLSVLPFAVAGAELSVPLLLIFRRTRAAGVVFTVVFHVLLSFSPNAIGLAFSGLLFAMLVPFLSERQVWAACDPVVQVWSEKSAALHRGALVGPMPVLAAVACAGIALLIAQGDFGSLKYGWWLVMVPIVGGLGAVLLVAVTRGTEDRALHGGDGACLGEKTESLGATPLMALWALAAILPATFLLPYSGAGTVPVLTMYSNLRTEAGDSNHFVMPALGWFSTQDTLVTFVHASSPELGKSFPTGMYVTLHEARRLASSHPGETLEVVEPATGFAHVVRFTVEVAQRDRVQFKLVRHRPIDPSGPSCQW